MKLLEKIKKNRTYKDDIIKTQIIIVLSISKNPKTEKEIKKMIYGKRIKRQLKQLIKNNTIKKVNENKYIFIGEKA